MSDSRVEPLLSFARVALGAGRVEVELDAGTVGAGASPVPAHTCERAVSGVVGLVRVMFSSAPSPAQERLVEVLATTVGTALRGPSTVTPSRPPDAGRDVVTGLPARVAFLAGAHARLRDGVGRAVTLLVLELDALPEIGEHLGRAAVEHALRTLTAVLGRAVRGTDVLGHLSGEVLLVLLCDCDERAAGTLVSRIRHVLAEASPDGWPELQVDVGTITAREAEPDLQGLLEVAEASLFVERRSRRARLRAV
jgi:diguanylate cyclase (GGDEF)-like protein